LTARKFTAPALRTNASSMPSATQSGALRERSLKIAIIMTRPSYV
jgi:hypothetical protein